MTAPHYPAPFLRYVKPARIRPQLWRLVLGILMCTAIYIAFVGGLLAAIWALTGSGGFRQWAQPILTGRTPTGTLILLGSFTGMALGPMLVVRILHKRSISSLFGRAPVVIRDFTLAALIVGLIYLISSAIWAWRFDAAPNIDPVLWLKLLPLALIGVAIQTGAEELVFRGYLQQQLAARFRSPLIWLVLPALIFGAVHYDATTAGPNVWIMMAAAAAFGLVAADLTAATGSIGAAWGFHFANNVAALLIVTIDGPLSGLALFVTPYAANAPVLQQLVWIDIGALALMWLLLRRILAR